MKCRILYPLQRDQSMKESLWPLGPFCCVGIFGEVSNFDCARRSFISNGDSPNGTLSASELKDAYKAAEPRNGWGPRKGKGTRTAKGTHSFG